MLRDLKGIERPRRRAADRRAARRRPRLHGQRAGGAGQLRRPRRGHRRRRARRFGRPSHRRAPGGVGGLAVDRSAAAAGAARGTRRARASRSTRSRQDERLAIQIDLDGEQRRCSTRPTSSSKSPPPPTARHWCKAAGDPRSTTGPGRSLAQGVTDMRMLPPGAYFARAHVRNGTGELLGEMRRPFTLEGGGRAATRWSPARRRASQRRRNRAPRPCRRAPRRSRAAVHRRPRRSPPGARRSFLDRVAARPDAASPMIRDLVRDARANIGQLYVSDVLAAQSPVAAFLQGRLAAVAEQAGAGRRLVPQRDARLGGLLSGDGLPRRLLRRRRQRQGGLRRLAHGADQGRATPCRCTRCSPTRCCVRTTASSRSKTLDKARARWPADDGIKRRFVLAALLAGEYADGLQTLDELVARKAEDEPSLAGRPARPVRSVPDGEADRDRRQGSRADGAARRRLPGARRAGCALIDTWLAAAKK